MSQSANTIEKQNGSVAVPLLKVVLVLVALAALGFSMVTIDIPNQNYVWIVVEIAVAVLLIQSGVSNLRRVFGGKR